MSSGGERDPVRVTAAMTAVLVAEPLVTADYAVVVDPATLRCPAELHGEVRLLVAAKVGAVRLIDNEGVRCRRPNTARADALVLVQTGEER